MSKFTNLLQVDFQGLETTERIPELTFYHQDLHHRLYRAHLIHQNFFLALSLEDGLERARAFEKFASFLEMFHIVSTEIIDNFHNTDKLILFWFNFFLGQIICIIDLYSCNYLNPT